MFDSIRMRLTLWHVAVLALLLAGFCAGVYALFYRDYYTRIDAVSESVMDATVSMLAKELSEPGLIEQAPHDALKALSFPGVVFAIYDSQGQLVAEKPPGANRLASLPAGHSLPEGSLQFFTKRALEAAQSKQWRAAALHARFPLVGRTYQVVISQPLEPVLTELAEVRRVFYIAVPLALLLASFAGWFLARKTLAPVVTMSDQARRIGAESLQERLRAVHPRDELGRLATTFNELLDRLGAAFALQRRFMTDASHELRNPISVIRTAASVTLGQQQRNEQEYRSVLQMIDEQARQLSRIVEDMFRLARADAGSFNLQVSGFHLDELIAETVHDARVLSAAKGISIEMPELPEAPFQGDEDLVRQMVLNLLDNSIKYTPAGGRVRLNLERESGQYTITISDTGIGIPKAAQSRVFERFYRAERGHTGDEKNGPCGAGLGLSIARWIAAAHHGHLDLRHSDDTGSTFAAVLPVPAECTKAEDREARIEK